MNRLACLPSSPQALRVQLSPPPWGRNHTFTYFQNYVDASCLLLFPLWFYLSLWVSPIFIPYCPFRHFERAWIETQSVMLNQRFYNAILILPCFPWCILPRWSSMSKQHLGVVKVQDILCKRRRILGYTLLISRSIAYLQFSLRNTHRPAFLFPLVLHALCLPPFSFLVILDVVLFLPVL